MNDPYQILGVNRDATEKEVRNKFKEYARKNHPDKGGNEKKYKKVKNAAKILIKAIKDGVYANSQMPHELKDSTMPDVKVQGDITKDNFTLNSFNKEFTGVKKDGFYTFDIEEDKRVERTQADFNKEQMDISGHLESMEPLFKDQRSFDSNLFHHVFEKAHGRADQRHSKELQEYGEPQATVSGQQAFTDLNQGDRSVLVGGHSSFGQDLGHHPQLNDSEFESLRQQSVGKKHYRS